MVAAAAAMATGNPNSGADDDRRRPGAMGRRLVGPGPPEIRGSMRVAPAAARAAAAERESSQTAAPKQATWQGMLEI